MMKRAASLFLLFLLFSYSGLTQGLPEKPNPPRLVVDYTHTLSSAQMDRLEQKLKLFSDSGSVQIAVVLIPSLQGNEIADYANKLANKWGIGQKNARNGLLLLSSMQDRQVRIEVGYGLEGVIPDAYAKRIISEVIIPEYKKGNYFEGLDQATNYLIGLAKGDYPAQAPPFGKEDSAFSGIWIVLIILIILFFLSFFRGKDNYQQIGGKRHVAGNNPFWMLMGGGGRSGNGGGFGGFGGGSFGGGGASGRW